MGLPSRTARPAAVAVADALSAVDAVFYAVADPVADGTSAEAAGYVPVGAASADVSAASTATADVPAAVAAAAPITGGSRRR